MKDKPLDKELIVDVFSGTSWEAALLTSIFDDAGIKSFQRNNVNSHFLYDPINSNGVKVSVLSSDMELATLLVTQFYESLKSELPPDVDPD